VTGLVLAAGYPAARFLVALAGGWLSDHLGRRASIAGSFFLAGGGLVWPALAPGSPFAIAVGIFAIGLLGGLVPTLAMAYVGDVAHPSARLLVHSTLFTGRDVGVAAAMVAGQALQVGSGGFGAMYGAFAVVFLICGTWSMSLSVERMPLASP
jgi:MFS family permease